MNGDTGMVMMVERRCTSKPVLCSRDKDYGTFSNHCLHLAHPLLCTDALKSRIPSASSSQMQCNAMNSALVLCSGGAKKSDNLFASFAFLYLSVVEFKCILFFHGTCWAWYRVRKKTGGTGCLNLSKSGLEIQLEVIF